MGTIVTVEVVCAVFLCLLFVGQITEHGSSKSSRYLRVSVILVFCALIIDILAYVCLSPSIPFAFRYIICLLAYSSGGIVTFSFTLYSEAYFKEKTQLNPWVFRIVKIGEMIWVAVVAAAFIAGKIIVYENGLEAADYGFPVYASVLQVAVLLYTPAVIFCYRKKLGGEAVFLLSFLNIAPLLGILASILFKYDYTYAFATVALVLVTELLQRKQAEIQKRELEQGRLSQLEKDAANRLMAENNTRFFALEDDFESLYDVELESGRYVIYIKGKFYQTNVTDKLVKPTDYFKDLRANIDAVIYSEDREGLYNTLTREAIRQKLSENEHFDYYYRLITENGPVWFKMRVVYKNAEKKNIIIGVFNAAEEMDAKEKEAERLRAKELELKHTEFRTSALAYLTENEGDMRSYLNFYAGKLRELIGCDQVIYRDAKGDMFVNNAPELGEEYVVPIEICRDCAMYNLRSPAYEGGTAEMADIREGVNGIHPNSVCPVKSALTRIVNLDGKADGYLTIHYILDYHEFSDYERQTLEEFTNLLSLSLSRYAARTRNARLEQELGLKRQIEAQKEKLEEQQKLLEEAIILAKSANEAKSKFLFNMSHDIRTPMNAIKGFTAMAKKNADDREKVVGYLDKIDISGQQLLSLINQVLEMARIESGKVEFDEKPVNVREEFNSMVTVLSEQAGVKGLRFIHSLRNIEHNHVLADEARISSITLNITGNAMKYTPEGGTVEYELREVPSRKPGYATFSLMVSDTGIGMSREYLKELYKPFSREKNSTVSGIQGTGLGLSIVKNTIDLMGGNIEVQSEPGKGTRFDILMDFRIDENAGVKAEEHEMPEAISFEGRRTLLVEDNEMNREIARDILEEQGIIVEDAEDGDVAVSRVKEHADRGEYDYYDFVLMDVQMPRMNGYEATRAIRAIPAPEGMHLPIIAMTANAFEEDRQNALAAGMDEHLAKPIDIQILFRTIGRFLK